MCSSANLSDVNLTLKPNQRPEEGRDKVLPPLQQPQKYTLSNLTEHQRDTFTSLVGAINTSPLVSDRAKVQSLSADVDN